MPDKPFFLVAYSFLVTYFHQKPSHSTPTHELTFRSCRPTEYDASVVPPCSEKVCRSRLIPVTSQFIFVSSLLGWPPPAHRLLPPPNRCNSQIQNVTIISSDAITDDIWGSPIGRAVPSD